MDKQTVHFSSDQRNHRRGQKKRKHDVSLPIQTLKDVMTYARCAENVRMVRKGSLATDWKECSPKIDYSCKYGMWRMYLGWHIMSVPGQHRSDEPIVDKVSVHFIKSINFLFLQL